MNPNFGAMTNAELRAYALAHRVLCHYTGRVGKYLATIRILFNLIDFKLKVLAESCNEFRHLRRQFHRY